jgi:hypothetical protein
LEEDGIQKTEWSTSNLADPDGDPTADLPFTRDDIATSRQGEGGGDGSSEKKKQACSRQNEWVGGLSESQPSQARPTKPGPTSIHFIFNGWLQEKKNQLIESLLVRGKYMCSPEASCVCTTFKKEKNNEEKSSKLAACRLPLQENKINVGPDWEKQSL